MSSGGLLTISISDHGAEVVITVAGELDFAETPSLLEASEPIVAAGRSLVLDLTDLTYCDSSGLRAMIVLHQKAAGAGGELCLVGPSSQVSSLITRTRLDRLLTIRGTTPEPPSA